MAEALLALEDVLVQYGEKTILDVPCLAVFPGEVLAVIGPNGAGKSTLLRVMGLLERPAKGRISFHGNEPKQNDSLSIRRQMASVFHEPLLLNASVYENAALGLKLRGLSQSSIEQRVLPWLERLEIAHLANRPARSLSGGEAQRTSLARALDLDPELLLLDEPFSSLDPPTREGLLLDLYTILRETGMATVFVTHDKNEAFMLADRVGILIGGKLLQVGPATQIFNQPNDEEVAHFVGIETKISGVVDRVSSGMARVCFDGGAVEVVGDFQSAEQVLLCLRPEDIILGPLSLEDLKSNSLNRLTGKIVKITPWGSHYRVALECVGSRLVAAITRSSFLELGLQEGEDAVASFKDTAVHVIRRK